MIYFVRIWLVFCYLLPFLGIFFWDEGGAIHSQNSFQLWPIPPEILLIFKSAVFAFVITVVVTSVFFILLPHILSVYSTRALSTLVFVSTALYFVPVVIKAKSFQYIYRLFLGDFGLTWGGMYFVWTILYGLVFFWAALYAFVSSTKGELQVMSIWEYCTGFDLRRYLFRILRLPIFTASCCVFAVTFFAHIEIDLFMHELTPVPKVLDELFGGRENDLVIAATFSSLLGFSPLILIYFLSNRSKSN